MNPGPTITCKGTQCAKRGYCLFGTNKNADQTIDHSTSPLWTGRCPYFVPAGADDYESEKVKEEGSDE